MKFWIFPILAFFLTLCIGSADEVAQPQIVQAAPDQAAAQAIVTFETGRQPTSEIHVAITGNDSTGNGSPTNPYQTIGRGIRRPSPALPSGFTREPTPVESTLMIWPARPTPPSGSAVRQARPNRSSKMVPRGCI